MSRCEGPVVLGCVHRLLTLIERLWGDELLNSYVVVDKRHISVDKRLRFTLDWIPLVGLVMR